MVAVSISTSTLEAEIRRSNFKACLCQVVSQDSLNDQMRLVLQMNLKNNLILGKLSKEISQYGEGPGFSPQYCMCVGVWVLGVYVCVRKRHRKLYTSFFSLLKTKKAATTKLNNPRTKLLTKSL